jgi:hypothetical protein
MKYFVAYTYTKENNPFPLFGNKVIDTEYCDKAWSEFLEGSLYELEKEVAPYYEACVNLQIICVSEIK